MILIHKSSKAKKDSGSPKIEIMEPSKDMGTSRLTSRRLEEMEKKVDEIKTELGNSITMMYDNLTKKLYSIDEQFGNLHKDIAELRRN